ncbi:MAG: carboxymethylenebutenolidase [Caldimonas sp.]|uniref:dienelactone hydrolase family protein n=1 Tax=Caldimonas taiwanensis TaxID=307483 RepID=UPI0007826095|nr:dienelactone hydrolase family protein [Caldimonas taiwanensis]GIX24750.1 MAG: carboxymethylenebutenolidase [Caldimonas sp.]
MSQTVPTRWIDLPHDGRSQAAYLALPPAGRGPGLVLFQEIFGVNAHIRAVAEHYALAGYVVLAPDVFWRQAPRVELGYDGDDLQRARALLARADPAQLTQDAVAAVQALRGRAEVVGGVGVLGYCLGGRLAYLAAAHTEVDAAVAYYGGGIQDRLDLAERVRCPMLLHYGQRDAHIPLEAVQRVRQALPRAQVHVYAEADHGFNCWARATYHPPSAALALARSLTLLATTLF